MVQNNGGKVFAHTRLGCGLCHMGCVDCGGDNNWDNCDALEIEKGTNRLPKKLIIQSQAEVAPNGSKGQLVAMQIETERLKFIQRQIRASESATATALQILDRPAGLQIEN